MPLIGARSCRVSDVGGGVQATPRPAKRAGSHASWCLRVC